jgi:hypothetical protein
MFMPLFLSKVPDHGDQEAGADKKPDAQVLPFRQRGSFGARHPHKSPI